MPESIPSLRAVPVVPKSCEDAVDDFDERMGQEEALNELVAINTAMLATDFKESADEARRVMEQALQARQRLAPRTVEDHVIHAAMAKILGRDVPLDLNILREVESDTWERKVTKTVARAWIEGAQGCPHFASHEIPRLRERQGEEEDVDAKGGAVNLMTLYIWSGAVAAHVAGDNAEAARLWKRALAVASSFGADASLLVQWTYAASFFPTN